jgi:hypothetical protein
MLFSFFKTRKVRQFDYTPRYYDEEAEARAQRKRELAGDAAPDSGGKRIQFRRNYSTRAQESKRSNRHVLILVVLLGGMFYLLIQGYLDLSTTLILMAGYVAWRSGTFHRFFGKSSRNSPQ